MWPLFVSSAEDEERCSNCDGSYLSQHVVFGRSIKLYICQHVKKFRCTLNNKFFYSRVERVAN